MSLKELVDLSDLASIIRKGKIIGSPTSRNGEVRTVCPTVFEGEAFDCPCLAKPYYAIWPVFMSPEVALHFCSVNDRLLGAAVEYGINAAVLAAAKISFS